MNPVVRIVLLLQAILAAAVLAGPSSLSATTLEPETEWPGADYRSYIMRSAQICQAACEADRKCRAWTFVKPGSQRTTGTCRLKGSVPPARAGSCCVSGVKQEGSTEQSQRSAGGSAGSSGGATPPSGGAKTPDPEVRQVQARLATLGYRPGPADGLMGPRTRKAIEAFQRDRGLAVDGRVSPTLRDALRNVETTVSTTTAPALPEALRDLESLNDF